jgi:hypothetical protein
MDVGQADGRAVLSKDDVLAIRALRRQGADLESLAILFGVSQGCINHVASGRRWAHVRGPVAAGSVRTAGRRKT